MIASVSSYVVPAVLSFISIAFVYLLGRRHPLANSNLEGSQSEARRGISRTDETKRLELEAKLRTPENEIERDALEIFAREHFDNVYASIAKCLLSINDKTPWDGYKSGKIITQEKANKMLATKPSIKLSRTQTLAESQDKFVCLLSDYADQ